MPKAIGMYSRKAGMPREAFFQRYEYGHVPLVQEIFPHFAAYTRSYPQPDAPGYLALGRTLGFDALTEIWSRDKADTERTMACMAQADNAQRLAVDEAELFDRSALLSFSVTELGAGPSDRGSAPLKVVALYDKPAAMAPAAFQDHVETALLRDWLGLCSEDGRKLIAACRRNHLIPGTVFQHPLYEKPTQIVPDLILQLWFAATTDLQAWLAAAQSSEAATLRAASVVITFGAEDAP